MTSPSQEEPTGFGFYTPIDIPPVPAPVPNEPSDEHLKGAGCSRCGRIWLNRRDVPPHDCPNEPSAIGDELEQLSVKLQKRFPDLNDRDFVWLIQSVKAFGEQQTKLARLDTAKRIKTSDPRNLVIFLTEGAIYLKDYIARLEASIKERSEG